MTSEFRSTGLSPSAQESTSTKSGAAVAMMLGSAASNQVGASLATLAFNGIGPIGVVALRQWVAAAVLVAAGRPRLWRFSARQWRLVFALSLVFALMNISLYTAIERIGLGLGVTLEFLGPLTIALLRARGAISVICAIAAAAAVAVLMRPTPTTDYLGTSLGLLAAACWGCYILLNREVGSSLPGLEGSAAASLISAILYLPVGLLILCTSPPSASTLGLALAAGVLSSAVPFLADLLTLRRISAQSFGMFMSVNPVFAVLVGAVVLGQHLDLASWIAVAVIVSANVIALLRGRHSDPQSLERVG